MLALHKYNSVFDIIPIVLVCFMLPLLGLIFFRKTLPEIAGKLIVSNSRIVWKCFLYKTVALNIDECSCVGVKIFATSYKGYIKNIQNEYGRGDEFAYIYISKFAISDNCFSTIGSTPCKNGFIKFLYSDSLCKELMNILPKSKVTYLASFYNQMQISYLPLTLKILHHLFSLILLF